MSNTPALMGMPREVLLIILVLLFSDSTVKTRSLLRRSARNKHADAKGKVPTCLAVLLVNKALFQIGSRYFHDYITVWSETIFRRVWDPKLSWVYYQVPWKRIRYISGNHDFAENLSLALESGLLCIKHIREVAIRYRLVLYGR